MSKTRDAATPDSSTTSRPIGAIKHNSETEVAPAMKPRPALMVILGLMLVALLVGMLLLYFKTVYPNRHEPHVVETDTPTERPKTPPLMVNPK
jgi:hypothetical protein